MYCTVTQSTHRYLQIVLGTFNNMSHLVTRFPLAMIYNSFRQINAQNRDKINQRVPCLIWSHGLLVLFCCLLKNDEHVVFFTVLVACPDGTHILLSLDTRAYVLGTRLVKHVVFSNLHRHRESLSPTDQVGLAIFSSATTRFRQVSFICNNPVCSLIFNEPD